MEFNDVIRNRYSCKKFTDRAPEEDTLRWLQTVNSVFDQYGIGRALWTYRKMDFGLMDPHYDSVREGFLALNPTRRQGMRKEKEDRA